MNSKKSRANIPSLETAALGVCIVDAFHSALHWSVCKVFIMLKVFPYEQSTTLACSFLPPIHHEYLTVIAN